MVRKRTAWNVLFVVDVRAWALELKTLQLRRFLQPDFNVLIALETEVTPSQLQRADLVVVYFWQQIGNRPHLIEAYEECRDKLLIGICAHNLLEGAWREPGLALMRRLARAVFVTNRLMLQEYPPLFDVPVWYTPNGVDTRFFRPALIRRRTPGPMRVGWAGSLTNHGPEQRGYYDVIVPAVEASEGIELVVAAREDRWRTPREMRDFYRQLDVYVCASRSEGTPNPCMEAAACGVPLVGAPVGVLPELIRNGVNGFLVERNVSALAARLQDLRDDPTARRRMGAQARREVRRWDWRRLARNYETLFRSILEPARCAPSSIIVPEGFPEHAYAAFAACNGTPASSLDCP